jgi:hypothetical protein
MRLGQLARKLNVGPNQIVEFLATQNIVIETGANTRIHQDYVLLATRHFGQDMPVEGSLDEAIENHVDVSSEPSVVPNAEQIEESQEENAASDPAIEKAEVIKAPKIELSGLKVLGKIELPELPKKEPQAVNENTPRQKDIGKERRPRDVRRNTSKNPIALQREQEAREARKKREEENKNRKERRTQNYLKKVKAPQPTKAVRIFKEETQQMSAHELQEPPKSLWGRFVKWLTT